MRHSVNGQHNGSKSSSSLSQLHKSKQALNSSLLPQFNNTVNKQGPVTGSVQPQFARVDFDKLNNRKSAAGGSKGRGEERPHNDDFLMQSYQDIAKSGEQTCLLNLSLKGLGDSI